MFEINLPTAALIIGVAAFIVDRVMDARGWSRSSKTLRRENEDLVRRNTELEKAVERHERTIGEQSTAIAVLRESVRELQARDQQAVLSSLDKVASVATERHQSYDVHQEASLALLREIRDLLTTR